MTFLRLWARTGAKPIRSSRKAEASSNENPLALAGQQLKSRREELGLSMRQLSRELRITTTVLEALEKGWADRLPEAAYLGTMLSRLERHLDLPDNSLRGALPAAANAHHQANGKVRSRFTVGSVDILSTWQGSVVYVVVILGTLLALNQQQRYLAKQHSQQWLPIAPSIADLKLSAAQPSLPAGASGLRPLDALRRQSLRDWLPPRGDEGRSPTAKASSPNPNQGLLELNLSKPSSISLLSGGGDRSELRGTQGELVMLLQGPVQLTITPAPDQERAVLWNGEVQASDRDAPGTYRLPQTEALSP